jgi:hypothetical protein
MIVFDLKCGQFHIFEAWFGSTPDYESQNARGLIACPACGDTSIAKAVMAPAVAAKGNRTTSRPAETASTTPSQPVRSEPRDDGFGKLLAAQRRMEAASDYVGADFAARARAMHDGSEPTTGIHGEATLAEAVALTNEGIAIMPLPFRPLARSDA